MDFSVLDQLDTHLLRRDVLATEFAESRKFCGKHLYPGQRLLLKLIWLEDRTDFEEMILDRWIASNEIVVSPDIRERVEWCKQAGYPHFREIVLVGGRRSSKGFITGITLAKKMYDALQLADPNQHYGIDANKEIYFTCVAASEKQAKENQYADFANTVNSCLAMQKNIAKVQELEFSVRTEADQRRLDEWKAQNRRVQRDMSKLRGKALPANSRTLRGYTSMAYVFDEFAWFMQGESDQADDQVYEAATPSLAQFGRDGIVFCNSSPYSKVGKFYEKFDEAMSMENGKPLSPMMFTLQIPSWALYEGWWDDPSYTGPLKCLQTSPDWDPDRKKEDDEDEHFYTLEDRNSIPVERSLERENPTKYKVERRGQFAEVVDAYLAPEMVDRMFMGRPLEDGTGYEPMVTNWDDSRNIYRYKAHLDPSSTTAGFGFALGHTEHLTVIDVDSGNTIEHEHVIMDIIKRWRPQDFPDGVIDWAIVINEVFHYIDIFRPYEVTFDQFQSAAPIQELRNRIMRRGIGETRVFEKTATATYNWNRAEVFKTALYQGIVHAPFDFDDPQWSAQELKYLQEIRTGRIPRVEKQDIGPVQTKDMADCVMEVTEALIGNVIMKQQRAHLADPPAFGALGGYPLGGANPSGHGNVPPGLIDLYGRRTGEQAGVGSAFSRATRTHRGANSRPSRSNPARGGRFPQR